MRIPSTSSVAAPGPIGIDPGEGALRLVQLARTGSGVTVRAAASQSYVPGDRHAWVGAVSRALDSAPFAGRGVVAALGLDILHVRTVRVPASVPEASIGAAAESEAAKLFPFPLAAAVVQCLPAGEAQGDATCIGELQREVVVLAALRRRVDALVDDLQAAGVVVESLDAEPCALFRAARPFQLPGPSANVLVDVGERQTQVVIGRGPAINFIKSIDVGGWHFDQAVGRKLNAGPAEARLMRRRVTAGVSAGGDAPAPTSPDAVRQAVIDCMRGALDQLSRTLTLYLKYHAITFRGPGPACVHLMGAESDNEMLRASLSAALGLPVVSVDPFSAFSRPVPRAPAPSSLSTVSGDDTLDKLGAGTLDKLGAGTLDKLGAGTLDKLGGGAWSLATGLALKKLPGKGQTFGVPPGEAHEVARA